MTMIDDRNMMDARGVIPLSFQRLLKWVDEFFFAAFYINEWIERYECKCENSSSFHFCTLVYWSTDSGFRSAIYRKLEDDFRIVENIAQPFEGEYRCFPYITRKQSVNLLANVLHFIAVWFIFFRTLKSSPFSKKGVSTSSRASFSVTISSFPISISISQFSPARMYFLSPLK